MQNPQESPYEKVNKWVKYTDTSWKYIPIIQLAKRLNISWHSAMTYLYQAVKRHHKLTLEEAKAVRAAAEHKYRDVSIVPIEYIQKEHRVERVEPFSEFKQAVHEINCHYSNALNAIWKAVPDAACHLDCCSEDWKPHWIAIADTILSCGIGDKLDETHYKINRHTLEFVGQGEDYE